MAFFFLGINLNKNEVKATGDHKYKVVTIVIVYNAPLIRTATTGAH